MHRVRGYAPRRGGLAVGGAIALLILLLLVAAGLLLARPTDHAPLRALMKRYTQIQRQDLVADRPDLGKELVDTAIAEADRRTDSLVFYAALAAIQEPAFRTEDRVRAARLLATRFPDEPYLANVILSLAASPGPSVRPIIEAFVRSSRGRLRVFAMYALARLLANPLPPSSPVDHSPQDVATAVRLLQEVRRLGSEYRHPVYSDYSLAELADGQLRSLTQLRRGETAPEIDGTDLSGQPLRLADLRGRVVVLYFWGGW